MPDSSLDNWISDPRGNSSGRPAARPASFLEEARDALAAVDAADRLGKQRRDGDDVDLRRQGVGAPLDRVRAENDLDRARIDRLGAAGEDAVRHRREDPPRAVLTQRVRRLDERRAAE